MNHFAGKRKMKLWTLLLVKQKSKRLQVPCTMKIRT